MNSYYRSKEIFQLEQTSNGPKEQWSKGVMEQRSNGLVVKVLDPQYKGPEFITAAWLQGQLDLSHFQGRLS